jgi:glutathione synthase/RimK-type ligase-like ATP-grasp enzyme
MSDVSSATYGRASPHYEHGMVVKPEVGAGSLNTRVFREADSPAAFMDHLAAIRRHGAALIQPYLKSVEDYGERSIVWIDGAVSHAIRKAPRFSGDDESVTGPFPIADDERDVAERALAPIADRILYGRVDLARDEENQPVIMELELVEPSLFFGRGPGSVERFVGGLWRRLRA